MVWYVIFREARVQMPGLVIPKLFLLARSESAYLSVWVLLADLEKEWKETPGFLWSVGLLWTAVIAGTYIFGVGWEGSLINFQYVNEVATWSCDMGLRHMGGCNTCMQRVAIHRSSCHTWFQHLLCKGVVTCGWDTWWQQLLCKGVTIFSCDTCYMSGCDMWL